MEILLSILKCYFFVSLLSGGENMDNTRNMMKNWNSEIR